MKVYTPVTFGEVSIVLQTHKMSLLCTALRNLSLKNVEALSKSTLSQLSVVSVRHKCKDVELPSNTGPGSGKFRRIVHYPEEYTVKPLKITNLGGRDPISG